jgi:hypothetical protein
VLGPASNILYSIRSEDYYFNLNLNNLLFMATVPIWICFCASGATGHLVVTTIAVIKDLRRETTHENRTQNC